MSQRPVLMLTSLLAPYDEHLLLFIEAPPQVELRRACDNLRGAWVDKLLVGDLVWLRYRLYDFSEEERCYHRRGAAGQVLRRLRGY